MNQRKEKISSANNHEHSCSGESDSDDEGNSSLGKYYSIKGKGKVRQRQENSLGELTKNFINYIKEQKSREIDINEVVKILKVKKRRIYDITNVLEGNLFFKQFFSNFINISLTKLNFKKIFRRPFLKIPLNDFLLIDIKIYLFQHIE